MARRFTFRRSTSYDPRTWIDPAELAAAPAAPERGGARIWLCLASAGLLLAGAGGSWLTRAEPVEAAAR